MRAVAVMGVAAASALSLSACSADGGDAQAPTGFFQVREVAAMVPMAQWTEQAGDADAAAKVLSSTGLDGSLTVDEYLAMVDAGCPTDPLAADEAGWLCKADQSEAFLVFPAVLTADDVDSAEASPQVSSGEDTGGTPQPLGMWEVRVNFTESGAAAFEDLTADLSSRNPGGSIALVVDGEVITAPMVMSPISGGSAQLVVPWTKQEAESLAASLVG